MIFTWKFPNLWYLLLLLDNTIITDSRYKHCLVSTYNSKFIIWNYEGQQLNTVIVIL